MPTICTSPCMNRKSGSRMIQKKIYFRRWWSMLLLSCLATVVMAAPEKPGDKTWIDRPWEFRYVLLVESPHEYELGHDLAKKWIDEYRAENNQTLEAIFPLTTAILTGPEDHRGNDKAIGSVLISFNEQGEVLSHYDWPHKLHGRLNRIYSLVLASGDGPQDIQFRIGKWYTGRSDTEIEYVPAICTLADLDERYKKGFSAKSYSVDGNFGCREWGYYLQNPQIPYIDVTSYGSDKSTYIRPVIGWGRFDTPPKPVIGKHGSAWVCLHECPNSEAPGIIPDIKLWAARNGWPVPKPPKKQPMFPDRQYKRGELVD
ncbi:MAG: hypothetical protein LWW83_06380 [Azonexaceae bacterium]|nr:hypothetical protein [Azonexaceae bacterium]